MGDILGFTENSMARNSMTRGAVVEGFTFTVENPTTGLAPGFIVNHDLRCLQFDYVVRSKSTSNATVKAQVRVFRNSTSAQSLLSFNPNFSKTVTSQAIGKYKTYNLSRFKLSVLRKGDMLQLSIKRSAVGGCQCRGLIMHVRCEAL